MSTRARAADEHLRSLLARLPRPGDGRREAVEPALRQAEHAVDAYEAVGLLSPERCAEWRRRFAHAAEDPFDRPPPDAAVRSRAERWLRHELVADPIDAPRIHAGLESLAAVGAVAPATAAAWQRRVEEAIIATRPDADAGWWRAAQAFGDLAPIAILPGSDPRPVRGLAVTAIELHEAGLVLHTVELAERGRPRPPQDVKAHPRIGHGLRVGDDAGTDYRQIGGGSSSGAIGSARVGEACFVPRPPERATRLHVTVDGDAIAVPLA
ncbi:MAG: hypothetical protein QOJ35_3963 [Solirubrobacteraceae bacterium]|nr:hypothetical protein [Solirubrobacteraceae bacterium]